ncbi:VacJ family lipoprotein [Cupriavidus sp. 2TAF22]
MSAAYANTPATPSDPLEPVNRAVFAFNDHLDQYVAAPIAKGYKAVTPSPVRTAVSNVYSNLSDVGNFANNLLQGKGVAASESLMRVAINSVFGIGGLIDIATPAGLQKHSQDFGLTLGAWGVPAGPYVVLPLFGPSTGRDGVGLLADHWLAPVSYLDPAWRNSATDTAIVNGRTNVLGATDLLSLAALDKYTFVRDAYLQRRNYLLSDGKTELPVYDDPDAGSALAASTSEPVPEPGTAAAPAPAPAQGGD